MPLRNPSPSSIAAVGRAAVEIQQARRRGEDPRIEERWTGISPVRDPGGLAALVKADLKARFALGERPDVAEYLDRFPGLRDDRDRVVSLVYEEYCLREESGERLDPDAFCGRYEPWRDSLVSQLRYHRALSQVAGTLPTPPRFPEPGEKFLWFKLGSLLGQGGAGRVYLAVDEELGDREVALKISPDRGGEPSIQGRLDHAHIVPVLSVAREPETGLRGLCMPYRPGRPLDEVTRRVFSATPRPRKAIELWDAARPEGTAADDDPSAWAAFPVRGSFAEGVAWIVATLAEALAHAHDRGVCHRDVKPANVLITRRDGPQLLDFNLAHDPHAADQADAALRGGTLPYMAPEQLEAFLDPDCWGSIGPSADIYALGLLLRELLTGRRPEAPPHDVPLPRAVNELLDSRDYPPTPLRELVPGIPRALDAIASRCLAPAPADRYASAADLAEDLRLFLDQKPIRHTRHAFGAEEALNWVGWHRRSLVLAASLLILSALAVPAMSAIRREMAAKKLDLAVIEIGHGQFDRAAGLIRDAGRLSPGHPGIAQAEAQTGEARRQTARTKLDLATIEIGYGQFDRAMNFVRDAERLAPGDPRAVALEAQVEFKQGNLRRSFDLYSRMIEDATARRGPEDVRIALAARVDRAGVESLRGNEIQSDAMARMDREMYGSSWRDFQHALQDLSFVRSFKGIGVDDGLRARIGLESNMAFLGLASIAHADDEFAKQADYLAKAEEAVRSAIALGASKEKTDVALAAIKKIRNDAEKDLEAARKANEGRGAAKKTP